MKAITICFIIVVLVGVCLIGRYAVGLEPIDVMTSDDIWERGYKVGCSETYEYLREPGILREHQLNQVDPTDFGKFMWGSREKEER